MRQAFPVDQLHTFVTVLQAGSITAAAPRLHLSTSAVSEQLRKLEEQAGAPLLVRAKAGVSPTEPGRRLQAWAQRVLALSEQAWRDLHQRPLTGRLRLGVTDYFRPGELAGLLARLQAACPGLGLEVSVGRSAALEADWRQGGLDLVLAMHLPAGGAGAKGGPRGGASRGGAPGVQLLRREPLRWMAAPGWRPERGRALRLLALPADCALHQLTVALLAQRRRAFSLVHQASGVAGLQSALVAGLGLACLNESALAPGIEPLAAPHGLPALPQAAFVLLPPRPGDSALVGEARAVVAQAFA